MAKEDEKSLGRGPGKGPSQIERGTIRHNPREDLRSTLEEIESALGRKTRLPKDKKPLEICRESYSSMPWEDRADGFLYTMSFSDGIKTFIVYRQTDWSKGRDDPFFGHLGLSRSWKAYVYKWDGNTMIKIDPNRKLTKLSDESGTPDTLLPALRASIKRDGSLLDKEVMFKGRLAEVDPTINLRQRTYELLNLVREPSVSERETLRKRGYVLIPIRAKSLGQIVAEDPYRFENDYELDDEGNVVSDWLTKYLNRRPTLRDYTPPAMIIAVRPDELLYDPYDKIDSSQKEQLRGVEMYSQEEIEWEFPDAKAVILPASVLIQADMEYRKRGRRVIFEDLHVRALDRTSVGAVRVGRGYHGGLEIGEGNIPVGPNEIRVIPALIFLRPPMIQS